MNSKVTLAFLLLCGVARADCPDKLVSCPYEALGRQGTCWKSLRCQPCGPKHCPAVPTSVPKTYQYPCHEKVRADKVQVDGCSNPLSDPLSTLYKGLFRPACVEHDVCYHNPVGIKKSTCDADFKANMTALCRSYYKGTENSSQLGSCLAAVGTWFTTVANVPLASQLWDQDQAWTRQHCQ